MDPEKVSPKTAVTRNAAEIKPINETDNPKKEMIFNIVFKF
jgi:hypothetical protein